MLQQLPKVFQTRNLGPTCSSSKKGLGPGWPPTIQAGVIYYGKFSRRKADVQWTLDICFVVMSALETQKSVCLSVVCHQFLNSRAELSVYQQRLLSRF